jgi:hypothetical protein
VAVLEAAAAIAALTNKLAVVAIMVAMAAIILGRN